MKVILDGTISSISASSENAAYPAANLMDSHPKKMWKAAPTVSTAVLVINLNGEGLADLGIVGTNATKVRIAAPEVEAMLWETDGGTMVWENSDSAIPWEGATLFTVDLALIDPVTGDIWLELETNALPNVFALVLEAPVGETLYAGCIAGGHGLGLPNPKYPIDENLIDYGITKELSNGSQYYRKRKIVRQYAFEVRMRRDTDGLTIMRTLGMGRGREPLLWRITDQKHSQWIVYARTEVSTKHDHYDHSTVSFKLTEAV